jgi:hypothetical protein
MDGQAATISTLFAEYRSICDTVGTRGTQIWRSHMLTYGRKEPGVGDASFAITSASNRSGPRAQLASRHYLMRKPNWRAATEVRVVNNGEVATAGGEEHLFRETVRAFLREHP